MSKIFCVLTNETVASISASMFFAIEKHIIDSGLGEDKDSFETIKARLLKPPVLNAEEVAEEAIYVILAGGFKQKIAKAKWKEIMAFINNYESQLKNSARLSKEVAEKPINLEGLNYELLLPIFNNVNKTRAIAKIWNNRNEYRDKFYSLKNDSEKLAYLETLPHIGKITKNHLARNLGINNVKYDVWIQRLGLALAGDNAKNLAVGFPLAENVKICCDNMFAALEKSTGLNKGYIDVVLWKACQERILIFEG